MGRKNKVCAIIVAGGDGKRLGADMPKQYLKIGNQTILEKTIKAFSNNELIDKICVVISEGHDELFKEVATKFSNVTYCYGGRLRQDSVRNGLKKLESEKPDLVLIHDAARPFVSDSLISRTIEALKKNDAVLPVVKVLDTIKFSNNDEVEETLDRNKLFAAQTPQGFKFEVIKELHEKYKDTEVTDDVALAEKAGIKVKMIEGEQGNYKITTDSDLKMARLMEQKKIRVGNGFDVHQFEPGDAVILCGVKIPHTKKLKGHSDADCAWHALTDALLGCIGAGDIGEFFPDTDMKWKGADSVIFLQKAVDEIKAKGGEISNADITIICEEPKMKKFKLEMKQKTAKVLGISEDAVNVKATTTEQLGFLGRKEGLAVFATATVYI